MDIRLPIPKNWQDFEKICHRLWSEIWNDPNAQINGRQGQEQAGVDIFGKQIYSDNYQGVQCKDKDGKLGSMLKTTDLLGECEKAKLFKPKLATFTLATTSPRDKTIQEYYREINDSRKFPFEVNVWSWDDIESEIAYRPSILKHYYPTFEVQESLNKVILNRYSTKDHLKAFFSRPNLQEKISNKFKSYILPVIYELSDNAYKHGKGRQFEIEIEQNQITLLDNGIEFNPLTSLSSEPVSPKGKVGSFVFKTFQNRFNDQITIEYSRQDNKNKLKLSIAETLLQLDDDDHFELSIDLHDIYGRDAVRNVVKNIPTDKGEIIVNVKEVGALSGLVEFIWATLEKLSATQELTLILPRHEYVKSMSDWFKDKRLKIKER